MMFYKLFKDKGMTKVEGTPYFQNFFDSYWDLYVLVTTANSPDIMMPAYDQYAFYSIFFIVFEVVCVYIFMSIFLAVVYNNYRKNLKTEVKEAIQRKRDLINQAFDMMKSDVFGREVIIQGDFNQLLKKAMPNKSEQYFKILWFVLDVDTNGYIDRQEFHNLPDLMNIKITEVKPNLFERFIPDIYRGKYSKLIIQSVKHKYFRYSFDAIILINAIVILSDLDYIEWGFLAIFSLEILLKIYAFGFRMFISKYWNIFDATIIGSAFIFDIIDGASDGLSLGLSLGDADGSIDGLSEGESLGLSLGEDDGSIDGASDGLSLGLSLGEADGSVDGLSEGEPLGLSLGEVEGVTEGLSDG